MGVAAELIREARQSAGLTMSELAERAGTSKPTVSRYENGLVDPGTETLNRLLHACGQELRSKPVGLPSSVAELAERFEGRDGPDADDVTRTSDGRELRTAADLEAFAAELRADGLLAT
jgi:transcriptional regulator with XRE-family HTH domain